MLKGYSELVIGLLFLRVGLGSPIFRAQPTGFRLYFLEPKTQPLTQWVLGGQPKYNLKNLMVDLFSFKSHSINPVSYNTCRPLNTSAVSLTRPSAASERTAKYLNLGMGLHKLFTELSYM